MALREGRVFVNGRRQSPDESAALERGAILEVYPRRDLSAAEPYVLDRRHGVLAVFKPSALPTEPDRQGSASVITRLAEQLAVKATTLHACSRLDVGVSGVVVIAENSAGRHFVEQLRARGAYRRRYLAIASGGLTEPSGTWHSSVTRQRPRPDDAPRAQPLDATSRYNTIATTAATTHAPSMPRAPSDAERGAGYAPAAPTATLLELWPETGRKHQLRQHCAEAGVPLYGDRRCGGPTRITASDGSVVTLKRIALHAARVVLGDSSHAWHVTAPVPADFIEIWMALNGDPAVLEPTELV